MGSMFGIEEDNREGKEGCFRLAVRVIMYVTIATFIYGLISGQLKDDTLIIFCVFLPIIAVLYILKQILP